MTLPDTALEKLLNELVDYGESPSSAVAARELDQALEQALKNLAEPYREVIRLRNYERCSFEEIGRRLDRSEEAARKLWVRALRQLSQLLEPPRESP